MAETPRGRTQREANCSSIGRLNQVFVKADASKYLAYNAARRAWQISRGLGPSGSYASCPGEAAAVHVVQDQLCRVPLQDVPVHAQGSSPTELQLACNIGSRVERGLRILDMPLPESLHVSGAASRDLGFQGDFCLHGFDENAVDARTVSTPKYQLTSSRHCGDGMADGSTVLRFENNSWIFERASCDHPVACNGSEVALAACRSRMLRPDRLPAECFGFLADDFSIAHSCARRSPLSLEVRGPAVGPGSQERGDYERTFDVAGRPAYQKPDRSRHLLLS